MQSFETFERVVVGGVDRFQFIPTEWVASMPKAYSLQISELDINLVPGKDWLDGFSPMNTLEYEEKARSSSQGVSFSKELTGLIPGDVKTTAYNLYSNRHRTFLLRYVDSNGKRRLLGSLKEPMRLSFEFKTGQVGGTKGYTYRFYGNHRAPSPHLLSPPVEFWIDENGYLQMNGSTGETFEYTDSEFIITGPNEADYFKDTSGNLRTNAL